MAIQIFKDIRQSVNSDLAIWVVTIRPFLIARPFFFRQVSRIRDLQVLWVRTWMGKSRLQVIFIYKHIQKDKIQYEDMDNKQEKQQKQQNETMVISVKEWQWLNQQLRILKQENYNLKQKSSSIYTPLISKNRSLVARHSEINFFHEQIGRQASQKEKFKSQMSDWSKRMSAKKDKFKLKPLNINNSIRKSQHKQEQAKQISLFNASNVSQNSKNEQSPTKKQQIRSLDRKLSIQQQQYLIANLKNELHLIQNICLFGPDQQAISSSESTKTKSETPISLLYSLNPSIQQQYLQYGYQLYPIEGVPYRKLKPQEISSCTDKIIFRRNAKRMDCSLLLFQAEEGNTKLEQKNQLLARVNPMKRMSTFYVQFNDFMYVECQEEEEDGKSPNKSVEIIKNDSTTLPKYDGLQSTREKRPKILKKHCIKSSFCLCIFTYFPFINLMKQLITSLMDQIKIRRVQKYASNEKSLQKISIDYLSKELHSISTELASQVSTISMQVGGEQWVLSLGHFKIIFNFMENRVDDLLFGNWVFDIMKLFHRDAIYDVFTNFMAEESICFVCQNLQLLTETVFFFASVLANPFEYPHPCVSRTMNYDLLDSPFVVTLGFNQSSKWAEQTAQKYEKRIFVDLNGKEAKIYNSKKLKQIKSQKLKKIFHLFYKRLQGSSPMPQFFKKKQTIIRAATRQQNQLSLSFIKSLSKYFQQELIQHLPNPQIIATINESSPERNEHSKISSILREVQKYVKESRKPSDRDSFIELLTEQQVFFLYIQRYYGLKMKSA